ncbi:MAG: bifunctional DNA-formamidopyrimidine glycosylase/DNA-(apurinic or apyrimidinic site) lyase [Planctomycetales bacterium]|nr:bifunctional DNA-formamidopyrimidine glycosylase/DNA-(apurinic or apyrimidinic site) lyase [Planctomycetales bacterium]NIM10028.1 bifunctional DNA-formamidopyrimidine glycosylase/DNA-(apurinic or apyrimidinic site) lyase [Planctomycetales bacterium]NIN09469.1 bifunctional DNA-formamidopyrimidine glycosylase/DNA-(apurinic or apyrimidinic site) lyase [Planctomycetales bacterium]NIN78577.1 bifunctional DNA-formamidopyrimidine glycosylase/DNA-(apurinic or apyrimidinic site) lyase [Planctomycetale
MPELPEVETMRRGVAACVGRRIAAVAKPRCRLKPIRLAPSLAQMRRRVVGQRIGAVDRAGKRVLVRLENDDTLVFEPRMTGLVLLADPPNRQHLRLQLVFDDHRLPPQLMYWDRRGLGSVRLMDPRAMALAFGAGQLGTDALKITARQLQSRLAVSRREIKVALLDQRAVAGIGNLYAAEILHVAGLHPRRHCDRLTASQWQRLHRAMRKVLQEAIRYEGSTLSDGTYRNALNRPGRYQNRHRVYQRAGQMCLACGSRKVERIVQAQRATFFCPACQPLKGKA